jgi:hypothetical protein
MEAKCREVGKIDRWTRSNRRSGLVAMQQVAVVLVAFGCELAGQAKTEKKSRLL